MESKQISIKLSTACASASKFHSQQNQNKMYQNPKRNCQNICRKILNLSIKVLKICLKLHAQFKNFNRKINNDSAHFIPRSASANISKALKITASIMTLPSLLLLLSLRNWFMSCFDIYGKHNHRAMTKPPRGHSHRLALFTFCNVSSAAKRHREPIKRQAS